MFSQWEENRVNSSRNSSSRQQSRKARVFDKGKQDGLENAIGFTLDDKRLEDREKQARKFFRDEIGFVVARHDLLEVKDSNVVEGE